MSKRPTDAYFGWDEGTITFIDEPVTRGGPGSGHRGHKGRPGKVGGSLPGRRGVTRPITPGKGKRLISAPTGAKKWSETKYVGAREWIVISQEEIAEIENRTRKEMGQIAFEQSLADMIGTHDRQDRIERHAQSMELFHQALMRYTEQVRPTGGWLWMLRNTAGAMRIAAEAYREDGNEEHLTKFWEENGGTLKFLMHEGDEEQGITRQRGEEELYQIMSGMDEGFSHSEYSHVGSPLSAFYHMSAMAGSYRYNLDELRREQERAGRLVDADRWTDTVARNVGIFETRGDSMVETADRVAFELATYEERREHLENEKVPLEIETHKLNQKIRNYTSEIDAIISAGGPSDAVLAQTGPLQEARSELYDQQNKAYDEISNILNLESERQDQLRTELIAQVQAFSPDIGEGFIRTGSLEFEDSNWLEMGVNVIGDATYWELLRDAGDEDKLNAEMARAEDMAREQYGNIIRPAINDGLDFLDQILPAELKPYAEVTIQHDPDEDLRAHYVSGSDLIELEYGGANTVIHEVGHFIEDNNPRLREAAIGFLLTQGEDYPIRPLIDITDDTGYNPWEMAFDGAFTRPYSGKVYYVPVTDHYRSTEIISMGLEQLYEDAVGFARRDPDHYTFMMGLLTGEYLRED